MSDHSFNIFIAQKYGVDEAIFVANMVFWTRTNAAKQKNFKDGRYWSYGKVEFFNAYFTYWTRKQMRNVLERCVSKGILLKSNYNKVAYDRTNWYSLSDDVLRDLNLDITCLKPSDGAISPNGQIDWTERANGLDKKGQPIPDTKPYTKPDTKEICTSSKETPEEVRLPSKDKPKNPQSLVTKEVAMYIAVWNELAVQHGLKPVGHDKRQLNAISRHIKVIKKDWEIELSEKSFRTWLTEGIKAKHYRLDKFKHRMDICLRWEAFMEIFKLEEVYPDAN